MISVEAVLCLPTGPVSAPWFMAKDSLLLRPVGPDILWSHGLGREGERRADGIVKRVWGLQLDRLAYSSKNINCEFSLCSCYVLSTVLRSLPELLHK